MSTGAEGPGRYSDETAESLGLVRPRIPHVVRTKAGDFVETDDFETARFAAETLVRDGNETAEVYRVLPGGDRWAGTARRNERGEIEFVSGGLVALG